MRALFVLVVLCFAVPAQATNSNLYCFNGTSWSPCTPTNPLATTGSSGGGTSITNYALEANGVLAKLLQATQSPIPTTAPTNCSGTITTGGTAQLVIPVGVVHGFQLQNNSGDPLAYSWTTTTPGLLVVGSWTLNASGGMYQSPIGMGVVTPVYINGTTGDRFTCAWW